MFTVLKIIGWVLLSVLLLILAVMLGIMIMPLRAEAGFVDKKFSYRIRLWFINVLDSHGGGLMGFIKKLKSRRKKKKADSPPPDSVSNEETSGNAKEESPDGTEEETSPEDTADEAVSGEKTEKPKKRRKKDVPDYYSDDDLAEEEGKSLGEKVEFILDLWRAADRPVLRIFKGIRLYDLFVDFIISNQDAYKCAMNYGRLCGVFYPLLGWLSTLFTVRLRTVDINAGFGLDESRWDASVKVSFRVGTVVIAGIQFLFIYSFRYFIPAKMRERKQKKAARQK